MHFGSISKIILIGGDYLLHEMALKIVDHGLEVVVVSGTRLLEETFHGETLRHHLQVGGFEVLEVDDIHDSEAVERHLEDEGILGVSIGSPWIFKSALIKRFKGRMVNVHPVGIPQFDGGAHFTWQILMGNRIGAAMVQAVDVKLNSGDILMMEEYAFSSRARIPLDYFSESYMYRRKLAYAFLERVFKEESFDGISVDARFRTFFPRLYTISNGWIDWSMEGQQLERFICAFDSPYLGASTYVDGMVVRLKDVSLDSYTSSFHPFMGGIVYKKLNDGILVAVNGGSLIVRQIFDEAGKNITGQIRLGSRFMTPYEVLENARGYIATYSSAGICD